MPPKAVKTEKTGEKNGTINLSMANIAQQKFDASFDKMTGFDDFPPDVYSQIHLAFLRIRKRIKQHQAEFDELMTRIQKKYVKFENGNAVIPSDKIKAYNDEIKTLENTPVELDHTRFNKEDSERYIQQMKLSSIDMELLEPFFTFE